MSADADDATCEALTQLINAFYQRPLEPSDGEPSAALQARLVHL